jgi:tetratricopeptide (TPR) repeat protein
MKIHLLAVILPGIALAAPDGTFETPALLVGKDGKSREIRLMETTKDTFRYREANEPATGRSPDDGTIYLYEPQDYSAAMDLYQGRKYGEAKAKFIAIKERFQPIQTLENSPVALAAFYEMECLRKLGDLEGLAAALQNFPKGTLTRETQLRQLELYVLWDAVRTKTWDRLDALAKERVNTRLPGDQRAQVAWCHGLALEGLNRPEEALPIYQTAITADSGASEEIARQAALRILAIHKANPEVQEAIKLHNTGNENKSGNGHSGLMEAAAIANLFELSLGAGTPLPAEFKPFLKYKR